MAAVSGLYQSPYLNMARQYGNMFGVPSPTMPGQAAPTQNSFFNRFNQPVAPSPAETAQPNKLEWWEAGLSLAGGVLAGHAVSKATGSQGAGVLAGVTIGRGAAEMFKGGTFQDGLKVGLTSGVTAWAGFALTKGSDIGDKLREGMKKGGAWIDSNILKSVSSLATPATAAVQNDGSLPAGTPLAYTGPLTPPSVSGLLPGTPLAYTGP